MLDNMDKEINLYLVTLEQVTDLTRGEEVAEVKQTMKSIARAWLVHKVLIIINSPNYTINQV